MSDEFGSDFITIVDDDGEEIELEVLDEMEYNGVDYIACIAADSDPAAAQGEDDGVIILKSVTEDGEEFLSTPDTDEELNEVYQLFMERLFEDEEE